MRQQLIADPTRYQRLFYIMTLGTLADYRHAGIGSALVQQCIAQVERDPACGVLYLHVITFNAAAIRFYEKLGFYRVEEIDDYYTIDGVNHNCYLYAKYFHGTYGTIIEGRAGEDSAGQDRTGQERAGYWMMLTTTTTRMFRSA